MSFKIKIYVYLIYLERNYNLELIHKMTCSEQDQNIEMPRDDGLVEKLENESFYHYYNDTFKEENVNKERKRPPANSGVDFRAGSSFRNEHRGKNNFLVIF